MLVGPRGEAPLVNPAFVMCTSRHASTATDGGNAFDVPEVCAATKIFSLRNGCHATQVTIFEAQCSIGK